MVERTALAAIFGYTEVGNLNGSRIRTRYTGLAAALSAAALLALAGTAAATHARRDDRTLVMDVRVASDARIDAARRLLSLPEAEAKPAILAVFDEPSAPNPPNGDRAPSSPELETGTQVLLRQIAAVSAAPAWLAEPLTRLAEAGSESQRLLAIRALGSVRSRDAARSLIRFAKAANGAASSNGSGNPDTVGPSEPAAGGVGHSAKAGVPEAALAALVRLTGRADLGYEARKWEQWWSKVEFVSDAEWDRQLSTALAIRSDELARERDAAIDRVLAAARKRYQASASIDARSTLLEEFILDSLPPVRQLGLELALQELANARTPGPAVADAAVKVLADPSPEFRRLAADALSVLASPDTATPINQALVFETDPSVAASLLRSAARWPTAGSVATVLRWLDAGEPAISPALDAASAMLDSGMLKNPDDRSRVLAAARSLDPLHASASALRLLAALGDDSDRAKVVALLSQVDPGARQRAAEALAREGGGGLDALLGAAMNDSSLFSAASRAVVTHRATPDGFFAIAALPAPSPDERRQQLMLIAGLLSPGELLAVARATSDADLREHLLARLTSEPLRTWNQRPGGRDEPGKLPSDPTVQESPNPEIIAGLLLLAQTRLDLDQPGLALKALDSLIPVRGYVDPALLDSMRTLSLLLVGRVSEAAQLNGSAESWVLGLEESLDEMHALDIAREIERRWDIGVNGKDLPSELATRVQAARAAARAFVGPTADVPR